MDIIKKGNIETLQVLHFLILRCRYLGTDNPSLETYASKRNKLIKRALNHMAAPQLGWLEFLNLAQDVKCYGVEFRNDLKGKLFDGAAPEKVAKSARELGLRILALAEVKAFDNWSDSKRKEATSLIKIAKTCGAEQVSLIARNDNLGMEPLERRSNLITALGELKSLLEASDLIGLIEPLGFETCALREKGEAVDAIEAVGGRGRFKIVHDTFHHRAAGGGEMFAAHTGIVHISGVNIKGIADKDLTDPMRGLVDAEDQLGNIEQLLQLFDAGYSGPVSFEPFAPDVIERTDPASYLKGSFEFIEEEMRTSPK